MPSPRNCFNQSIGLMPMAALRTTSCRVREGCRALGRSPGVWLWRRSARLLGSLDPGPWVCISALCLS